MPDVWAGDGMKAIIIGDIHLTDRPPSLRKASYADEILDKLDFAVRAAAERKADCIVSAGDVFHIKAPSRTSHRLVQSTHEVLTSMGIPVLIVPGNHDLQHDRLESLAGQPLGALGRMDGVEILLGAHETLPIFGLPYQQDWAVLPQIMEEQWVPFANRVRVTDMDWPLMVTHAPIFPDGEDPPYDYINANDWAELMTGGACYYGHIHDPHGAYYPSGSAEPVIMCNNGAISRGSLHAETLKRQPKITFYDSDAPVEAMFEAIEVPVKPVHEVFMLDIKEDADEHNVKMTQFLTDLGEVKVATQSAEEVSAHLGTVAVDSAVRDRAVALVEWAMGEQK